MSKVIQSNIRIPFKHFAHFSAIDVNRDMDSDKYTAGILACKRGEESMAGDHDDHKAGYGYQYQLEQNAGARRGVQQF